MRCGHVSANGKQCGAHALTSDELCFSHSPRTKEQKSIAVLKGGRAPKKIEVPLDQLPIATASDVLALLVDTINRVRTEPFTHQKANSVGYLANVALRAFEAAELVDRVKQLEDRVPKS